MVSNDSHIAFFDLDGTIIHENSGKILVKRAYSAGLMGIKDFIHALYLSLLHKFNWRDPDKLVRGMAGWVKGLPEEILNQFSEEVFLTYLAGTIRPEIFKEIKLHKERNARVVMLSSAIKQVCAPFAKLLEMDEVLCSELEVRAGKFTGRFENRLCYGEEKVTRLRTYCEKMNSSPEKAYYYADSISDFQALDSVGYPVCVNPDKKLAKVAAAKHWTIHECDFLTSPSASCS
jgi:putative phosphoserine phosphatase / 1-acylglycerol-3-phosphate O-acyltransferase